MNAYKEFLSNSNIIIGDRLDGRSFGEIHDDEGLLVHFVALRRAV
jgi:hypothetical protein